MSTHHRLIRAPRGIDAHLDVRPSIDGKGHSGSPFREAMEHAICPLPGHRYVCLGAQPHAVSREHLRYAQERDCVVRWCSEVRSSLVDCLAREVERLTADGCRVHVTIDADAVRTADVPGVSAPNPIGLSGHEVIAAARWLGSRRSCRASIWSKSIRVSTAMGRAPAGGRWWYGAS